MILRSHFATFIIFIIIFIINYNVLRFNIRSILRYPLGYMRTFFISILCSGCIIWFISSHNHYIFYSWSQIIHSHKEILLYAFLAILWIFAIETCILVISQIIFPMRSLLAIGLFIFYLPKKIRILKRGLVLCTIAIRSGLFPYIFNSQRSGPIDHSLIALYLREILQESGIIGIKLGQFLATRPDIVRPEYIAQLTKLQTRVKPEDWQLVERTLHRSWDEQDFATVQFIDPIPIAAASVAQVHIGRRTNQEKIAIKVRRTNVPSILNIDGEIIIRLSKWLTRKMRWAHKMELAQFSYDFIRNLKDELNLYVELYNLRAIGNIIISIQPRHIIVPQEIPSLCSQEVLTLQAIDGTPLAEAKNELNDLPMTLREAMAYELIDVILHLIFISGVFHADLHAGNLLVTPEKKLALLDFGMVGRLDRPTRDQLLILILAIARQDSYVATRAVIRLIGGNSTMDQRQLQNQIASLIMKFSDTTTTPHARSILTDLTSLLMNAHFTIPSDLSYAFRSLATLEGTISLIAPHLDMVTLVRQRAQIVIRKNITVTNIKNELIFQAAAVIPIMQKLPEKMDNIISQLENGKLGIDLHMLSNAQDRTFLNRQMQHIGMILVGITTLIIGVIFLCTTSGPRINGTVPLYLIFGCISLLIGFILTARTVAVTFQGELKNTTHQSYN